VLLGITVLIGAAASQRARLPAWLAWAGALAAAGLVAQGVLIAYEGFSDAQQAVGFAATTLLSIWLLVTAWFAWRAPATAPLPVEE
jgi:hypothetical protein